MGMQNRKMNYMKIVIVTLCISTLVGCTNGEKNVEAGEAVVLEVSRTKVFNPKWIDRYTIEYDNPKGEERVSHKVLEIQDLACLQDVHSILLESTEFLAECMECYEVLGQERTVEIADSIGSRLEEAICLLNSHEFYSQEKAIKDAVTYYNQTLTMLLEQAHIISEQGADKATVDNSAVEKEALAIAQQTFLALEP